MFQMVCYGCNRWNCSASKNKKPNIPGNCKSIRRSMGMTGLISFNLSIFNRDDGGGFPTGFSNNNSPTAFLMHKE